jgi:2-methylcitrate dehydratase PrpD
MAEEMVAEGTRGRSTIVGRKETVAAPAAALCNGTATHGFELDDLLDEAIVHPGAIIVPAAIAAAESVDAPGSRLLTGIVAGYEVLNRVGLAVGVESAHRGFHKTTLMGPIGAAVAAGVILELSPEQMMSATGLACSTSSGIKSFAAGTGGGMMKRMHAGRAAEAGVRMAQLAARDFTGPPSAIDGKFGVLEVYGGKTARPELLTEGLGKDWAMASVFVKVYSCCSWIQGAIQQLVALRGPMPLKPDEIKQVRIGVSAYAAKNNGEPAPVDIMGAQYSFPYCAALALAGDPTDPGMYLDKEIANPERRALARRVELFVDPEMEAAYPKHYGSRIELVLANGERRTSFVLDPHGFPNDPVTDPERIEKFARLAGYAKPAARVKDIAAAVQRMEKLSSARELMELIRN